MALNTLDILIAEAVNLQQTMVADMEEPEELREAVDLVGPLADWDRAKAALQLPKDLRRLFFILSSAELRMSVGHATH